MERTKSFYVILGLLLGLLFCFGVGSLSNQIPLGMPDIFALLTVVAMAIIMIGVILPGEKSPSFFIVMMVMMVAIFWIAFQGRLLTMSGLWGIIIGIGGTIFGLSAVTEKIKEEMREGRLINKWSFVCLLCLSFGFFSIGGGYLLTKAINFSQIKLDRGLFQEVSAEADNSSHSLIITFKTDKESYISNFFQAQIGEKIYPFFIEENTSFKLVSKKEITTLIEKGKEEKETNKEDYCIVKLNLPQEIFLPQEVLLSTRHPYLNEEKVIPVFPSILSEAEKLKAKGDGKNGDSLPRMRQ